IQAQTYPQVGGSPCFSVTATYVTDTSVSGRCNNGACRTNPVDIIPCNNCVDVTICMDSCSGLNLKQFGIVSSSSTDCHSVCSPTGDFLYNTDPTGSTCSWYNARVI